MKKGLVIALAGGVALVAGLVAIWIWLGEKKSPQTVAERDALTKAGCTSGRAFDFAASHDGGALDPTSVRYGVKCFVVRPAPPPTCEAVFAAYRGTAGSLAGDAMIDVELEDSLSGGNARVSCSRRFAPDGRLVETVR